VKLAKALKTNMVHTYKTSSPELAFTKVTCALPNMATTAHCKAHFTIISQGVVGWFKVTASSIAARAAFVIARPSRSARTPRPARRSAARRARRARGTASCPSRGRPAPRSGRRARAAHRALRSRQHAAVEDDDLIGVADRGEPMGDRNRRAAFDEACQRLLHHALVCVSSAEVASSRTRIGGLRRIARAIAIRCFSPPEKR